MNTANVVGALSILLGAALLSMAGASAQNSGRDSAVVGAPALEQGDSGALAGGPADHAEQARFAVARAGATGRLIVIDPGHGGTNTGAPGAVPGLFEKRLTLGLARQLAAQLEGRGYRVVLTRQGDEYLTLRERMQQANRLGAELFLSLHANATQTHAQRGYETFILTPRAVDVDGRALRAADGRERAGMDQATALILDDLERGTVHEQAAELAAAIQTEMRAARGKDGDRGVRQDSMHVLLGATMPAVLVEVGFVDHAIEGRELLDPEVRTRICTALTTAVDAVLGSEPVQQ